VREVAELAVLGDELRIVIREQSSLTNLLKARARVYAGDDLDATGRKALYRRLIDRGEDPEFTALVWHLLSVRTKVRSEQRRIAHRMGRVAAKLPAWAHCSETPGLGPSGLGKIVAEAPGRTDDGLGDYPSPRCVWRWFGLHVENDRAARPRPGQPLGYSGYRKGIAITAAANLVREHRKRVKDGHPGSEYGELFETMCVEYARRWEADGYRVLRVSEMAGDEERRAKVLDGIVCRRRVDGQALRRVAKRLLLDLWRAWDPSRARACAS